MKNDEFDRRVRGFFSSAPKPPAPESIRRLPATSATSEVESGRTWRPQVRRARGLAGIGFAGLVAAATLLLAIGVRLSGTNAAPGSTLPGTSSRAAFSALPATPAGTSAAHATGGLAWQEVGIGAFDGVQYLSLFPVDQGLLVVGTGHTAQLRLWLSTDGFTF